MVRGFTGVVVAILGVSMATSVYAQGAGDLKIGVVNLFRLMEASPQADEAGRRIEEEFKSKERELLASQKRLKALEEKLSKDGDVMSAGERRKLERDIIAKRRELKRKDDEFTEDMNFRRSEELAKVQQGIAEAIKVVAERDKFDLIYRREAIVYVSDRVDVTPKVLEILKSTKSGE